MDIIACDMRCTLHCIVDVFHENGDGGYLPRSLRRTSCTTKRQILALPLSRCKVIGENTSCTTAYTVSRRANTSRSHIEKGSPRCSILPFRRVREDETLICATSPSGTHLRSVARFPRIPILCQFKSRRARLHSADIDNQVSS